MKLPHITMVVSEAIKTYNALKIFLLLRYFGLVFERFLEYNS